MSKKTESLEEIKKQNIKCPLDYPKSCAFYDKVDEICVLGLSSPCPARDVTMNRGTAPTPTNNVIHPSHYNKGRFECIEVIEDVVRPLKGIDAFYVGNCLKYIWRAHFKNGVEDYKKAREYLNMLIDKLDTPIKEVGLSARDHEKFLDFIDREITN